MIYIRFFHAHPVATVLNEGKSELERKKKQALSSKHSVVSDRWGGVNWLKAQLE